MPDSKLLLDWIIGLIVFAVVVLVVVILLVSILLAARRILGSAGRSLQALERIRQNTLVLWELGTSNAEAGEMLQSADSIRRRVETLAGALETAEHGGRSA